MLSGAVHSEQIGKAEARTRLKALSLAIELVDNEIRDPVVLDFLLAKDMEPFPTTASIDAVLSEIRRRAESTSSRLDLLGTGLDERLERLSDAAALVAREVQDSALSEFLAAQRIEPQPASMDFGATLSEIKRQSESALSSPYLATKAGKTKAGAGRALPPGASSPQSFCAAVVLEAWAYFHEGRYPGASNPHLAEAAEEYWHKCGGTTNPWSDRSDKAKTLGAWRPYFKEASAPASESIRKELRRHVIESARKNR
jgi:hypothetical protein